VQSTTKESSRAVTKGRGILFEIAEVAVLALGLYIVINFAIQTVHVIGLSMYPTVEDQDYLIATKIDYRLHPPQRGDIIIMRDPYDPSRDFIKRVIGVPGDHILIRGGQVYINGHLLRENYINPAEPWTQNADWPLGQSGDTDGVLLRSDEYFVMGDNRNHSSDSRFFGPIHRDQVQARAWLRVLPLTKLGPIDRAKPQLTASVALPQAAA
jgi:signal peptidase I